MLDPKLVQQCSEFYITLAVWITRLMETCYEVCVYVSVYVYVCVCFFVCVCVCVCVFVYVCVPVETSYESYMYIYRISSCKRLSQINA